MTFMSIIANVVLYRIPIKHGNFSGAKPLSACVKQSFLFVGWIYLIR